MGLDVLSLRKLFSTIKLSASSSLIISDLHRTSYMVGVYTCFVEGTSSLFCPDGVDGFCKDFVTLYVPLLIHLHEQGVPFIHAGDDILRSKSLDRDSYNSGEQTALHDCIRAGLDEGLWVQACSCTCTVRTCNAGSYPACGCVAHSLSHVRGCIEC